MLQSAAQALGFGAIGISDVSIHFEISRRLDSFFSSEYHGDMAYLLRARSFYSAPIFSGEPVRSVFSLRFSYGPSTALSSAKTILKDPTRAYFSRHALGEDYHNILKIRLKKLAIFIEKNYPGSVLGICVDSTPLLEKYWAEQSGLGFQGKNTLLIHPEVGSFFFLGEILSRYPSDYFEKDLKTLTLPPIKNHCGHCEACIKACPTGALIAPFVLDARRCLAYLTIESKTDLPKNFLKKIGNRVYGCDDCQLVCPWNQPILKAHSENSEKFYQVSQIDSAFSPRKKFESPLFSEFLTWDEEIFLKETQKMSLRRLKFDRFSRNIKAAYANQILS